MRTTTLKRKRKKKDIKEGASTLSWIREYWIMRSTTLKSEMGGNLKGHMSL